MHFVSSVKQKTLFNKHLKVGVRPLGAYLVKENNIKGQESFSGLLWDILEYIRKARNCTFSLVIPSDRKFGYCKGNGTCTGMIGMVNRSEVDFALGTIKSPYTEALLNLN